MTTRLQVLKSSVTFRFEDRRFGEIDPTREVKRIVRAFEVLQMVVEPMELAVGVAMAHENKYGVSREPPVPNDGFNLQARGLIVAREEFGFRPVTEQMPRIDAEAIEACLQRAISQDVPGKRLLVEHLLAGSGRAKLVTPELVESETLMFYDNAISREVSIPVERRADGSWVSGHGTDTYLPPIEVAYGWDFGAAYLRVEVHWSPWYTPGMAEHALLCECLTKLHRMDWRLKPPPEPREWFAALEEIATEPDPEEASRWKRARK